MNKIEPLPLAMTQHLQPLSVRGREAERHRLHGCPWVLIGAVTKTEREVVSVSECWVLKLFARNLSDLKIKLNIHLVCCIGPVSSAQWMARVSPGSRVSIAKVLLGGPG